MTPQPALSRLGPYEIVRTIGRGGMAEVLLARFAGADDFQREVVIKRILPELMHEQEFIDMFRDEARITAQLRHGNIVQVLEFRHDEGQYYLVLEYVDGATLTAVTRDARTKQSPLPHVVVAHVLSEVARALDYAHRKRGVDGAPLGIIHRDVSPSNVLVSRDGEVKLADFGIARANSRVTNTRVGGVKGKIAYMAPEALIGEPSARSDLFSLGVMGWELLVGNLPFQGESNEAKMMKIVNQPVPHVSTLAPDVPKPMADVIMQLLEKNPDARPARASDVADVLGPLVVSASGTVTELLAKRVIDLDVGSPSLDAPTKASIVQPMQRIVLMVEGSRTARALLRTGLKSSLPITEVSEAAEAVAAAKTVKLALVVSQHVLAGSSTGVDLCRQLRTDPVHSTVPFVLVVFEQTAEIEQKAREAGVSLVVSKSDPAALVKALRKIVAEIV